MPLEYNATVIEKAPGPPDIFFIKVRPDSKFEFNPGQFAVLGLRADHPRAESTGEDPRVLDSDKLIRRAYSISSSSTDADTVEFYIKGLAGGELSPRLMSLKEGDRLWLGPRAAGRFTLDEIPEDKDLLLISTGTGLAPYLSMIRSNHKCNEGRLFAVVHGARHHWELGQRMELDFLQHRCNTLIYIPTLTRPETPEKNGTWDGHRGRVQSVFEDGTFEKRLGGLLNPERFHVFLCGNPNMVDAMRTHLIDAGFRADEKNLPGNLHIESYW